MAVNDQTDGKVERKQADDKTAGGTKAESSVVKPSLGVAITAAVAGAAGAQAQDAALEEIVVTATKRAVAIQDVPIAITAFETEEIDFQRFKNFADYVGQIPNLTVNDRQPGAQSVIMRGCAAQGLTFQDSASTSVYLDEQPITAGGYNPDPRLIDIARVEALAGPQGTLFGDAAQCGTLRIVTNKPETSKAYGWVDLVGSTVEDGGNGIDLSAMANIPLIDDKLALRLVGFYAEEPGWVDNVLSPTPGGQFDNADQVENNVNSSTWQGFRGMLRWNASEAWTIDLGGIYQKYELDGFGDVSLNQQIYADTDVFPVFGDRDQARFTEDYWKDEWYQVALTAEGDLNFGNFVFTAAYFDRQSEYNADATVYLQAFQQRGDYWRSFNDGGYYDTGGIYDFGGDPLSNDFDGRDTSVWSLEARYATPAEGRWSAIVGGFYSHREVEELFTHNTFRDFSDTDAFYYINYAGYVYYGQALRSGSVNWFSGSYESELDQWAIFGEFGFDITENFNITAGGRYYEVKNDYTNQRATLVGTSGGAPDCSPVPSPSPDFELTTADHCYGVSEPGKYKETGFVPKINLSYSWENALIYGTYSEGFRRGGANSARPQSVYGPPGRFPPPAGTLSEYDSDTIENIELGAKSDWFNNTLRLNFAIYRMTWDDIQIQAEDPQPDQTTLGITNFPQAEIKGAEAWLSWVPSPNWTFDASIGYNDGEMSKSAVLYPGTDAELGIPKGTQLPIVPDWQGHLNATYSIPATWFGGEPYIFARYVYTGESVNSLGGVESSEFENLTTTQSSWQTLDLQAGIEATRWSAALFVDNVTDETAELFYNNRFHQQRLSVNKPRTIGFRFRYRFND